MEDTAWVESEDVQLDRYNCDLNVEVSIHTPVTPSANKVRRFLVFSPIRPPVFYHRWFVGGEGWFHLSSSELSGIWLYVGWSERKLWRYNWQGCLSSQGGYLLSYHLHITHNSVIRSSPLYTVTERTSGVEHTVAKLTSGVEHVLSQS